MFRLYNQMKLNMVSRFFNWGDWKNKNVYCSNDFTAAQTHDHVLELIFSWFYVCNLSDKSEKNQ